MRELTRSLVLWFPDWPVTAFLHEANQTGGAGAQASPVAILEKNRVVASSASARGQGVRRGQRRRDAQARCPELTIVPADPVRDHRVFAPVVSRIEQVAPGVQIIRPGLCALRARGPARYYGGEAGAASAILEGVGDLVACAGVAEGLFAAELAARAAAKRANTEAAQERILIIPPQQSAAFLVPFSIGVLDDPELVGLLARLGVQTLGDFAALGTERVRERFGERGIRLHALAAGHDFRRVEPRTPPPELHREIVFEPPLDLADQVGFAVRQTAEAFIAGLAQTALVCTELRVQLDAEGSSSERVWLHPGAFDAAAIVDRVRWQLAEADELNGGISRVRISPEAVDAASHHAPAIFGSGTEERVHHALSRVQAMLGHRGVVTPALGGGRWLAERQVQVPWGDRTVLAKERTRPWPGSLPDPLPATVFRDPRPVEVTATPLDGPVSVDERGQVSASPALLTESGRRRSIEAWAGPWPIVERTWDAARARRAHRFQVVDADGVAWLLVCENGSWTAEGRYD